MSELIPVTEMKGKPVYYQPETNQMVFINEDESLEIINELDVEVLGAPTHLNPWAAVNSASRQQMQSSHTKQRLVVKGATKKRIFTGVEREYAKHTFAHRVPENCTVIDVIQRYPPMIGNNPIRENPHTLLITENFETKEIDFIKLDKYSFRHTTLGYKYKYNPALSNIGKTTNLAKNTVIADSPSVDEDGDFRYGIEANVAYMTIPGSIEDGFEISESFARKSEITRIGSRKASFGKNVFPLNLYGDENNYKPFPGPGDKIRPDGLVMALRTVDENFTLTDMHPRNLLADRVDLEFDKAIYGEPDADVVDVEVLRDTTKKYYQVPTGMESELVKYLDADHRYYEKILNLYKQQRRQKGDHLKISHQFNNLVTRALGQNAHTRDKKAVITKILEKNPIEGFHVTVKYAFTKIPTKGFKLTDSQGTKGVVVRVRKDEDMPISLTGVRADVIIDPLSVIKRSNTGQIFEQYVNASMTQAATIVRGMADWREAWEYLIGFYKASSPYMYVNAIESLQSDLDKKEHVDEVREKGIYLYLPPNSPNIGIQQIRDIEGYQPLYFGPVTYRGDSGRVVTTRSNIIVDSKYIMWLEKTATDYAAMAIGKRQHHGMVTQIGKADKYQEPYRETATRFTGEAEERWMNSLIDERFAADVMDRTNNPAVSAEINRRLLASKTPSGEYSLVDRRKFPIGKGNAVRLVKHQLGAMGIEFKATEFKPVQ